MWSWYKDDFRTWEDTLKGYMVLELLEAFSCMSKFPWDIKQEISKMADPDLGGYCTEDFRPLSFQKAMELCKQHPRSSLLFLLAFSSLLLLPQLVYSTGALQEVMKNLDFADDEHELEEEQADAAIEQSMLNARKIKHLGRVVSNHIVELNKRMRKYEKMLLTGVSPQNGQAMAAGYAAVPSKEPARFANGTAAYSAQEPARLANGTAAYSAQVSATPPALSPQGSRSTLSYGSQKGTQQPLMSLSPPVAYNGYSLPRRVP